MLDRERPGGAALPGSLLPSRAGRGSGGARVPAHAELCWLLNGTARIGWLNRMTQFKEKTGKDREGASIGLFTYPVLQAADVLLYRATHAPVGEDQKQHLELARDIAEKFNFHTGTETFVLPEPYIGTTPRGS